MFAAGFEPGSGQLTSTLSRTAMAGLSAEAYRPCCSGFAGVTSLVVGAKVVHSKANSSRLRYWHLAIKETGEAAEVTCRSVEGGLAF